jgi:hypothetical protein
MPLAVSNINRRVFVMETQYVANYVFLSRQHSSGPSHIANKSSERVAIRTQMFAKCTIR